MDEAADSETPLTGDLVEAFLKETDLLLFPCEEGEGFCRHYHEAMQRDPNLVRAHGELRKVLVPRGSRTNAS